MDLGLRGKAAAVAAGSQGIGRGVALGLAAEGCDVAICARGKAGLDATTGELRALGVRAKGVEADVSKRPDVAQFIQATTEALGTIDILVANAGGPPPGAYGDLDDAAWRRAVDLTLMSTVWLVREALPYLARRGGRIIAIASTSVKEPIDNLLLSNSLRLGVVGLLKTLSRELGPRGITVNAVLPGYVETDRLEELFAKRAQAQARDVQTVKGEVLAEVPLGRFASPEEVAHLVVFLASEKAAYITGTFIQVDGGRVRGY